MLVTRDSSPSLLREQDISHLFPISLTNYQVYNAKCGPITASAFFADVVGISLVLVKLELELAANILPRDHWCTFTFRDEDLPEDEKSVEACVKAFRRRIVRAYGKNAPVIFWRAEHKHEDDDFLTDRRWHVHACIQARSGSDYETLQRCWPYGRVDIEPIRIDKDHSYAQLAAYMVKEPLDRAGAHAWHNTRNAAKPEVETFPVPDDQAQLQPPKGALVYEDAREQNEYGSWRYVKYLAPGWEHGMKPRPRYRRRR